MQQQTAKPEHLDLWQLYSESRSVEVRNKIILEYSGLVRRIAVKTVGNFQFFNYLDDLINEGIIALMDAVEKFDLDKNVKFDTFASIKIKGAMIDFIRKQDCFPRRIKKMARTISEAESYLSTHLGHSPSQVELAQYLNVTSQELDKMQLEVYSLNVYSFEQMLYETNSENAFSGYFTDNENTPEQHLADSELTEVLARAIDELKENEKLVIALHYKEQLKIKDIAAILNISESRVSQIHSAAIKRLKDAMIEYRQQ